MEPEEVKRIRERLKLSQADLAELFGLASATVVSNIETGFRKPSATKIIMLRLLDSLPKREADELMKKMVHQARIYRE